MGTITINGKRVKFTDEKNVLTIIRKAGIDIPTLCYHSELSTFGACRLCTVEDDKGHFFDSCSEAPRDGMVIYTNPEKLAEEFRPSSPAMMVDNDCVIVTGSSLLQAFDRLEVMESTAHSVINSVSLGKIVHISEQEVADLKVAFHLSDD